MVPITKGETAAPASLDRPPDADEFGAAFGGRKVAGQRHVDAGAHAVAKAGDQAAHDQHRVAVRPGDVSTPSDSSNRTGHGRPFAPQAIHGQTDGIEQHRVGGGGQLLTSPTCAGSSPITVPQIGKSSSRAERKSASDHIASPAVPSTRPCSRATRATRPNGFCVGASAELARAGASAAASTR